MGRCSGEPLIIAIMAPMSPTSSGRARGGVAFLLAQVGAHATSRFAQRVAELELTPPLVGILRAVAEEPGRSQQALSSQLSLLPSRVVAFVDELESRGLVERRRNPGDRRLYALHLTTAGEAMMRDVRKVARAHDEEITGGLTPEQRAALLDALTGIAERQGLRSGVHPGFRALGTSTSVSGRARSRP